MNQKKHIENMQKLIIFAAVDVVVFGFIYSIRVLVCLI